MRTVRRYSTNGRRGFTLLESMIVIMYIAILAMIVIPNVTGVGRQAGEANLRATLHEMRAAVASFQAETGLFPRTLDDIIAFEAPQMGLTEQAIEVPINADDFRGPYLMVSGRKLPVDRTTGERTWNYSTRPPNVGQVSSLNSGNTSDGTPYSSF